MERARFKAYLEAFEQQLRGEGKSSNTLTSYTRDVREFLGFLASGPYGETFDELNENHIAAFIASLQHRELAQRSKAKKLTSIRSFLLFCRRNQLLLTYPPKLTFAKIKPLVAAILDEREKAALQSHTDTNGYAQLRNTRRYIRVPFYNEIRVKPRSAPEDQWQRGFAFDLGRGGMGLRGALDLDGESILDVSFELEEGGDPIRVQGRIAFLDNQHPDFEETNAERIGVEFTHIAAEDVQRLTDFVTTRLVNGHGSDVDRFAEGQNSRQFVRIPFSTAAVIRVWGLSAQKFEGTTIDLGVNGVSVKTGYCPADEHSKLRVQLGFGDTAIEVGGRVVNRAEYRVTDSDTIVTRMGIQFTEVDDHAATVIASFIRDQLVARVEQPVAALSA